MLGPAATVISFGSIMNVGHVSFDCFAQWPRATWKLCAQKFVNFSRSFWDILECNRNVFVGQSPFLKFRDTNVVKNGTENLADILHEL